MKSAKFNLLVLAFTAAVVVAAGTTCFAQHYVTIGGTYPHRHELRYLPSYPQPYVQPWVQPPVRLGFYGHFQWQLGMVVDYVTPGSIAESAGLESGDAIMAINGSWINSDYAYYAALRASGGQGTMLVRDVRTGYQTYVPFSTFAGGIKYYATQPGQQTSYRGGMQRSGF